jgi:nucleoside-diphosphate-sugar epimerase
MRVALTGTGGFIGSVTARVLTEAGVDVAAHRGPEDFDIADGEALERFTAGCDAVLHLAGPPSVSESFQRPTEYLRAHVLGTAAVLEAMRRSRIQFLVYVSSAEVYGAAERTAVAETHGLSPRSPYAMAKAAAERLVLAAGDRGEVGGYIVRPFSIYGPGMQNRSLLAEVLRQAESGSEIFVSDLRPIRDYCYVEDLAEFFELALNARRRDIVTLNASYGKGYSVAEVIQAVGVALGFTPTARERGTKRPEHVEILHLVGDPRTARRALGWRARHDLIEGIRHMRTAMVAR